MVDRITNLFHNSSEVPNGWAKDIWGNIFNGFVTGITPTRKQPSYFKGNIDWFTSGELKKHYIKSSIEKLTAEAVRDTNIVIHPKDTVVMAIIGLEAAGTRGSCALLYGPAAINQSCVAIYGTPELSSQYLYYFYLLNGEALDLYFCQGTKQQNLSADIVKQFPIIYPKDREEQKAIASALSDIDELIANLEKLIEKKKNIKHGVMQELLTGKKRLSGFGGAWSDSTIGSMGDFYNGLSGKTKDDFGVGTAKYIPFMNVLYNTVIDTKDLQRVSVREGEHQNEVMRGDLFFNTSSETPEEVGMCSVLLEETTNTYLNSFCFGFRLFNPDAYDPLFLSYYFNSFIGREIMLVLAQGSTRYNLSKENFKKTKIRIPEFEEQAAIAELLYDFDMEIQQTEKERKKYHLIKQGMMQKLLTGEIRLI